MNNGKGKYDVKTVAAVLFCALCVIAILYLIFRYALEMTLPFIVALFIAICLRRPSVWLSEKSGMSRGASSVVFLIIVTSSAAIILLLVFNRLMRESERLLEAVSKHSAQLGNAISRLLESVGGADAEKSPIIENLLKIKAFRYVWENIDTVISDAAVLAVKKIPVTLFSLVSSLPSKLVFAAVTLVASAYFCFYYDLIKNYLLSRLSNGMREKVIKLKKCLFSTFFNYIGSSLILLFITFVILFFGFLFLGLPSPFLLASIISFIDLLPLLGVGTVLIPWGFLRMILYRDTSLGLGLLILYAVAVIVRRIAEPKILGKGLGLHPLVTLFVTYIGMRLFGIAGMILLPIPLAAIKSFLSKSRDVDKSDTL